MIKTPVRGMRDITQSAMALRDYVLEILKKEAMYSGYQAIESPALEHIENLTSKEGGENEGLIFKVLKRGQALSTAIENNEELVDCGLRYDLTVPLARYYVNNQKHLPLPFKSFQIGSVWRADRPQRGRFRQFISCDLDILGENSILAEIDIILTTIEILSKVLAETKIKGLTVHLNDRRILVAAAAYAGFKEEDYGSVLIALDKNDKIGLSGVRDELLKLGNNDNVVNKFIGLFDRTHNELSINEFCDNLVKFIQDDNVVDDLESIISVVSNVLESKGNIVFEPTLVRGMGYYTGPIFECTVDGFPLSIAGGGRYDKLIGKISDGINVPACGVGIGFERIVTVLEEVGFIPCNKMKRHAILLDRKLAPEQLEVVFRKAIEMRIENTIATIVMMNKNVKYQIEQLEQSGYTSFEKIYNAQEM